MQRLHALVATIMGRVVSSAVIAWAICTICMKEGVGYKFPSAMHRTIRPPHMRVKVVAA